MTAAPSLHARLRSPAFLYGALCFLTLLMLAWRVAYLRADFLDTGLVRGGVLYTDEGWYANNAIRLALTGHWHAPDDMNFAVNLPTLQVFHALMFKIFGCGIASARLTIVFFFTLTLALVFWAVRTHADKWTALLAVALIVFNYFFFAFSRLALAEIPMTFFVSAALFMASRAAGPRARLLALAGGFSLALAFLTKSTAIFAAPLFAATLWWVNRPAGRAAWIAPAMGLGAFLIVALLHLLLLAIPHMDDFMFFHRTNVGLHFELSPATIGKQFQRVVHRARLIDKQGYRLALWGLPLLLLFVRRARRDPLAWFCVAWFLLYVAMFSFYANAKNRYWTPLMVPYGIGGALLIRHLALLALDARKVRARRLAWGLLVAASGLLAFVLVHNTVKIARRMLNPRHSFAEMARDIHDRMASDPRSSNVLMGHFSTTISLYEPLLPVNDRYGVSSLADRLERYRPCWLVTLGGLETPLETDSKYAPLLEVWRPAALRQYYRVELARTYDVLDNYDEGSVHLYRLWPLRDDSR